MARRFPLEAVLRLRKLEEQNKMKEFASFERVRARETEQLHALERHLDDTRAELAGRVLGEGLSSQQAQLYLVFFGAQTSRIRYQHDLLRKVEAEVRRKRVEMSLAMARRKIYDRLRERFLEEQERERGRRESRQADDITSLRFVARAQGRLAGA
ncbi:MAG: flagellar export protein FliJ [Nitrospinota bacterium]